jgi:HK97 family phage portal protein
MGIWQRLIGKGETRARTPTSDSFARATGMWASGEPDTVVSPARAENLATVLACVNAISGALATLPCYVYRRGAEGRVEQPNHPVARLLRRPSPRLSWPDLVEWWSAQVLLHGNGLLLPELDRAGRVVALHPVPWPQVRPVLLDSGRLAYDVVEFTGQYGAAKPLRRVLEDEAIHLRDRSDDGVLGRSRIGRAGEAIANAISLQTWSAATWRNAATPSGAITFPQSLTPEQSARVRAQVTEKVAGATNARKLLILESGAKFEAMSVSPEDAEVLDSRRFSVEELCRVFNVPPPIVQDYTHNTFTNSAQASLWFASNTLAPWVRKIEDALTRALFLPSEPDMLVELDLSGLMRGDYAARWTANVAAVGAGILDANEVREAEGYNPKPATPPADPGVP